ncbi:immunoglobulin superfamily containing leucine-rich repeat protein [Platysternon megacephalum]|nr:immunoglobulin superfamily containing leucine-rich repeat protein [Platysternon megacephalum]
MPSKAWERKYRPQIIHFAARPAGHLHQYPGIRCLGAKPSWVCTSSSAKGTPPLICHMDLHSYHMDLIMYNMDLSSNHMYTVSSHDVPLLFQWSVADQMLEVRG